MPSTLAQSKERKGSNFAIWQPCHKALTHLVYMPYAYVVDKFKWDVFSSKVREEELNCHWVKLRMDVQGELKI